MRTFGLLNLQLTLKISSETIPATEGTQAEFSSIGTDSITTDEYGKPFVQFPYTLSPEIT